MKPKKEISIEGLDLRFGEEMSYITLGELIQELTGASDAKIYKDFSNHGEMRNEEGYME